MRHDRTCAEVVLSMSCWPTASSRVIASYISSNNNKVLLWSITHLKMTAHVSLYGHPASDKAIYVNVPSAVAPRGREGLARGLAR